MQYKWLLLTHYFIRVYADPNLTLTKGGLNVNFVLERSVLCCLNLREWCNGDFLITKQRKQGIVSGIVSQKTPAKGTRSLFVKYTRILLKNIWMMKLVLATLLPNQMKAQPYWLSKFQMKSVPGKERCLRSLLSSFFVYSNILCKKHITCHPPEYKEGNAYCSTAIILKKHQLNLR